MKPLAVGSNLMCLAARYECKLSLKTQDSERGGQILRSFASVGWNRCVRWVSSVLSNQTGRGKSS